MFLFGRTAPVEQFLEASPESGDRIAVGSDSRLTGAGDLLQELRVARETSGLSADALLNAVTAAPARALRLPAAGRIAEGDPADLLVLPAREETAAETLLTSSRRDLSLVTIGGGPLVGAPAFRDVFRARRTAVRSILVDGEERLVSARLGTAIARSPIEEPGVEVR
jgi:cytosine/adenosine deaminase-related metal-dependent hydrolase